MTFGAFGVRSFRFQWSADLLTSWAFEMETLILGWYVMVNTGSVLWLTAFGSLQFLGTLAAPMFGVLGDRLGGRIMLCAMRAIYAILAALLMLVALTGSLTPAWVAVVAALAGIVRPNDLVMRNSLIGETIPPDHMMGALGLSRATMDSARVAGALAGAGLSTVLGIGYAYVVVTSLYLASLALTFGVSRRPPVPDPGAAPRRGSVVPSRWRDLWDGLLHVATAPALLAMMLLAFLVNLTAYPVSSGLMPYVAQQVYHVDATGLGWLLASFSFGGLLASITTVLTGGPRGAGRATLVHTALWYAFLLAFGHAPSMGLGLPRVGRRRLRPERGDDLDDRRPVGRRGPGIPRPGHGRAHARRLRDAPGAAGLRRPRRVRRVFADRHRALRDRPDLHRPHRRPVAGPSLVGPATTHGGGLRGLSV